MGVRRSRQERSSAEAFVFPQHRVPPRLLWALIIVLVFHGSLLLSGSFSGTYDAYVHMFLGDHYARDWFSTWEQRWYTGFTTVSYPPGTHMAIAAVSKVTGTLGSAFVVVQISVLLLLTVGMYRYSRIWVDERAAGNAALLLALSSSIAETVHVFGQLPTTFALALLLNAIPYLRSWIFGGPIGDLVAGVVILAACTAGHHVTTLFGSIFFLGPVVVSGLLAQSRIPREGELVVGETPISRRTAPALALRRIKRVLPATLRLSIAGPLCVATLVLVVLPYWLWSSSDPITQVAIPHGSRANFWSDKNLGLVFFVIPWGLLILALPYAIVRAIASRMWPLAASILLLFVLGTGGTTPIPRLLLGGAFDILTLDRFTFWATMQILPLAGLLVSSMENGAVASWLRETGGPLLVRGTQVVAVVAMVAMALFSANLSAFRPFQPDPIDTDPIVAFLEKDQHERWRFMTLGFGDQMAALSAATTATQVDGNYHSARRLPELTSTSVERLEGAKYRGISGLGSLQQFLEVPEKYHLKFVFSNDRFYDPLLQVLGWERLGPLENGIDVWEKADIEPLPAVLPVKELPEWQRFLWGTVPPSAIVLAVLLMFGRFFFVSPRTLAIDAQRENEAISPVALFVRSKLATVPTPNARNGRRVGLALGATCAILLATNLVRDEPTPEETVETYYDHLDFRRWTDAYDMLDPATRPSYELWRLQFSVTGGLLSSYAKLDNITTTTIETLDSRARVRADLRYLTALEWYPIERPHDLVKRGSGWFLVADEPDLKTPPDQLVRRSAVDFAIQGRRRVTSLTTDLTDVQDRPEIDLKGVRLMDMDGLPVVVGEVSNRDVDPADVTITAVLRNSDDEILARYNATDHLIGTLNPRESTPFRIDFQRVAAGTDLDFDPLDVQPIELTEQVASVEVYGKAVVTTQGLYRGLGLQSLELNRLDSDSLTIAGELRNDGVTEAIVPILVISYLDEESEVVWVERRFVEQSVRSQRSTDFAFEIPDLTALSPTSIDPIIYANGIDDSVAPLGRRSGLVEAPSGSSFSSVRVDVTTIVATEVVE